jgi:hypothetical protein
MLLATVVVDIGHGEIQAQVRERKRLAAQSRKAATPQGLSAAATRCVHV